MINSAIASVVGPWIMREMLGFPRMVEPTLTGRLLYPRDFRELFYRAVSPDQVMPEALMLAQNLAQSDVRHAAQ